WSATLTTIITLRLFGSDALAITTGVLTLVLMIYADIVPKTLAAKHAIAIVVAMAYPMYWLEKIMAPIRIILEPLINWHTGGKGLAAPCVTKEESKITLDVGRKAGAIVTGEVRMIKTVLHLHETRAEDQTTPRLYLF